ncbi:Uncharacterized protein FWK35_00018024 [Aphis craccivora]|uniref:Uncharacterized protein n=1 Tax=Aphis craccivora TaxID=307492 RepID=A0A6G0YYB2_APHCR|nr:Uncharacterized protein FWK35_00018024 [Aphis craccivora]
MKNTTKNNKKNIPRGHDSYKNYSLVNTDKMKRLKRGVLDDFEVENCDSVNMIYRCVMILKFVDVLLLNRRHKNHTAKQISLHLSLSSATTLHGISGSMFSTSLFTQSFQRKRGLPKGLLPTGFPLIVLTMDPTLLSCPG